MQSQRALSDTGDTVGNMTSLERPRETTTSLPGPTSADTTRGTTADHPHGSSWSFLTNHAHVLIAIRANPDIRQREIAAMVGITEGAVQRIISELEAGGYLQRHRVGRCNHYEIIPELPLRHPLEQHHTIGELVEVLASP